MRTPGKTKTPPIDGWGDWDRGIIQDTRAVSGVQSKLLGVVRGLAGSTEVPING